MSRVDQITALESTLKLLRHWYDQAALQDNFTKADELQGLHTRFDDARRKLLAGCSQSEAGLVELARAGEL